MVLGDAEARLQGYKCITPASSFPHIGPREPLLPKPIVRLLPIGLSASHAALAPVLREPVDRTLLLRELSVIAALDALVALELRGAVHRALPL